MQAQLFTVILTVQPYTVLLLQQRLRHHHHLYSPSNVALQLSFRFLFRKQAVRILMYYRFIHPWIVVDRKSLGDNAGIAP
jgi:hypothetical protein